MPGQETRYQGSPRRQTRRSTAALALIAVITLTALGLLLGLEPWRRGPASGVPSPTATWVPTFTPTAPDPTATAVPRLAITYLGADVDDLAGTVTFRVQAEAPLGREVEEVVLWYDTETGRRLRRSAGPLPFPLEFSYRLDVRHEALTRTLTTTPELDFWWQVRDTAGESVRAGGTALLGPSLLSRVVVAPDAPLTGFTWSVSETHRFQFYYLPGDAAERDLVPLGALAEAALERITAVLQMGLASRIKVYLVPRVFWQGGAAYSDKILLISYLDRNYTGVETWSYFTHEGTHALAQDLLQPKEEGGGPDGVLVEGLAVWASGGHYREEPIDVWAAVVAASDTYIPLSALRAGPFYDFQHEISYVEAASFVQFLVREFGLERLKELYGRATGNAEHDGQLVMQLYGKSYAELESAWLSYLGSLSPTLEEAEAWRLRVRSFDLMRRYETEQDPDARILPDRAPPDWTTDTLKIFSRRAQAPQNIVLETALISAQALLGDGGLAGASALLDDVEAALDAGGALTSPSLKARGEIVNLLAEQDRAVLRADFPTYLATFDPAYIVREGKAPEPPLQMPFVTYYQEVVRLDVAADGQRATAVTLLHAQLPDGPYAGDNRLFALDLCRVGDRWLVLGRRAAELQLLGLPSR